jgi:hypothetical protein
VEKRNFVKWANKKTNQEKCFCYLICSIEEFAIERKERKELKWWRKKK